VKVSLAWSTSAQMGFMLVQCGLGLWEMALLHLLAHSVYKAHAFLGAGGTVRQTQRKLLAPKATAPSVRSLVVGAAVALAGTAAVGAAWASLPFAKDLSATVWLMLGIVAVALVPVTTPAARSGMVVRVGRALLVPVAYLALHDIAARMVPTGSEAPVALLVLTGLGFTVLFVLQSACLVAPEGRLAQRIRPWIYAGLFLDDAFTRVAFAVSAPPAPTGRAALLPQPSAVAVVRTPRHSGTNRAFARTDCA
jgi:NAD(P)H-quinone oxidoreductase subunit 5